MSGIVTGSLARGRGLLRRALPFPVRVALRRWPAAAVHLLLPAPARVAPGARAGFSHVQCERSTPLRRPTTLYAADLQRAKEQNVARAAGLLDGTLLAPAAVFSWHRALGPPFGWRGFAAGPELHAGRLESGPGGGLCQVANLLYWLAVHAGLEIVERHGHDRDLYPDHERSAPFGCGATVFFPTRDLRFRNPHPQPVLLELEVAGAELRGRARLGRDPGARWEVVERDHRFVRRRGEIWRENRLLRRRIAPGAAAVEEPLVVNQARVAYPVPDSALSCEDEDPRGEDGFP